MPVGPGEAGDRHLLPRQDALEPTFDPLGGGVRRGLHWEGGRRALVRAALGRLYSGDPSGRLFPVDMEVLARTAPNLTSGHIPARGGPVRHGPMRAGPVRDGPVLGG